MPLHLLLTPPPLQQSLSHSLHSFSPTDVSKSRLFMFVFLAPAFRHWDKHNLFLMFSALRFAVTAMGWGGKGGGFTNRRSCKQIWGSNTGLHLRAHISITCLPQQIASIGPCSKWFRRRKKSKFVACKDSNRIDWDHSSRVQLPSILENYHLSQFHIKLRLGRFQKGVTLEPIYRISGTVNPQRAPTAHHARGSFWDKVSRNLHSYRWLTWHFLSPNQRSPGFFIMFFWF